MIEIKTKKNLINNYERCFVGGRVKRVFHFFNIFWEKSRNSLPWNAKPSALIALPNRIK